MRLTVRVLGFPVFEVELAEDEAGEFEAYQDAGSIGSTPIAADPEPFGEARISNHFWDPSEADEDKRRPGFWMGALPS